jgi:outer membrane protein assembly factor BamB
MRISSLVVLGCAVLVGWADDWPQWLGPRRDGVWRENGIIERFAAERPKVKWRVPVGAGYSGPAVSGGRVYLTDRIVKAGEKGQANPFDRGRIEGTERVLCLNEADGRILWSHEYDCPSQPSHRALQLIVTA